MAKAKIVNPERLEKGSDYRVAVEFHPEELDFQYEKSLHPEKYISYYSDFRIEIERGEVELPSWFKWRSGDYWIECYIVDRDNKFVSFIELPDPEPTPPPPPPPLPLWKRILNKLKPC